MRATLDIDADILKAAQVLAEAERKTLGQVLSDLVRKGLAVAPEGSGLSGHMGLPRHRQPGRKARQGAEGR
jgi:hypothetical protein